MPRRGSHWRSVLGVGLGVGLVVGLSSWAPSARAGNGPEPRTPVDWVDPPCLQIVDRSQDAVVHLDYAIPFEDTELTDDEVEDSRTHQFLAFCQARSPQDFVPWWISWADVERARDLGIAPDYLGPEDVLETNSMWSECFVRINADDDRRPITFAAAAEGVDWDTTGLAAGSYVVDGYTWEPPLNLWSPRPGVIKVVDDPDPAASAPALAVDNVQEFVEMDAAVMIGGCVSAEPGSVLDASWALPTAEVTWEPIVTAQAVVGETFSFEFDPPDDQVGEGLMVRVEVTDPSGRRGTSYMRDRVYVLGDEAPVDCEGGGGFVPIPGCEDSEGSGTGDSGGSGESGGSGDSGSSGSAGSSAGQDDEGGPGSCACRARASGSSAWFAWLLLLGVRRRGRA